MTLELAIFRRALERLKNAPTFYELATELGFQPVVPATDFLADRSSELHRRLDDIAGGLYRVGEVQSRTGPMGFWAADLRKWGTRSAERERARRRITKALVDLQPAGDLRFLLALTAEKENDLELVLPRPREDKSFGTIRAVINRREPTNHHLQLLADLVLDPAMVSAAIIRRWSEAFNVEKVAKRFYIEFRDLRNRVLEELRRNNPKNEIFRDRNRKDEFRRYVTRNLGRILFLWFLQSKGWLDGDRKYFVNLFERRCRNQEDHSFFRDTLIPLFFEALAKKPAQRSRIARELGDVPFLNGGLFLQSRFEDELYGEDREHLDIELSNTVFDPRQHTEGRPTVLGLLNSYRFTTRESTPDDQSVDPDPELLGKVFENLNEETERAETGTFYTPREVVHFMCRETLDGYLMQKTGFDKETFDWLRQEAVEPEVSERRLSTEERRKINQALDEVTVCDPAVGSGAFPVGMMHEILLIKRGLEQSTDVKVDIGGQRVAEWKQHIITNCLFGVDINPEAVEICHLRLWLSLVIDANQPMPLPNLDFRFVAGDSLVDRIGTDALPESLPRQVTQMKLGMGSLEELPALEKEIRSLRAEFAETSTPSQARILRERIKKKQIQAVKIQIDAIIDNLRGVLAEKMRELNKLLRLSAAQRSIRAAEREVENLEGRISFLEGLRSQLDPWAPFKKPFLWPVEFPEVFDKGGFDIVVANPPYVRQESLSADDQQSYQSAFREVYRGTADLLVFFYGRAIQILRDDGYLAFITSNKYMRAGYGDGIREHLPSRLLLNYVIDFGDLPVFDAAAYPAILIGKKGNAAKEHSCEVVELTYNLRRRILNRETTVNVASVREELENLRAILLEASLKVFPQVLLRREGWVLEDPRLISLFDRLYNAGKPLGDFVMGKMYYGIKTAFNEAYIINGHKRAELINADKNSARLIKPWRRGRDIKRWKPIDPDLYIIALQNSGDSTADNQWCEVNTEKAATAIFRKCYPALYDHVLSYERNLRARSDQGRFW